MEVAAAVMRALQIKRFNECPHTEWVEPNPAIYNPAPKPGELACTGCGALGDEAARKKLQEQKAREKQR